MEYFKNRFDRFGKFLRRLCITLVVCMMGFVGCASPEVKNIAEPLQATGSFEHILLEYVRGNKLIATKKLLKYRKRRPGDRRGQMLENTLSSKPPDVEDLDLKHAEFESSPKEERNNRSIARSGGRRLGVQQILSRVEGHNSTIQRKLSEVLRSRAILDRKNISFGPKLDLITQFYPKGILAKLTQSVIDGIWTRNSEMEQAKGELLARLGEYQRVRRNLLFLTLKKYIRVIFEQKREKLLQKRLQLAETSFRRIKRRLDAGLANNSARVEESRKVQSLLERLEQTRMTLQKSKNKLNSLMNRPVTSSLQLERRVVKQSNQPPVNWAVKNALSNRSDLGKFSGLFRSKRAEFREKKLNPLRGSGGTSYGKSNQASGLSSGLTADGRFSIPLFYGSYLNTRSKEEQAVLNGLSARMESRMAEIQQQVADLIEKMRGRQELIKFRKKRVERERVEKKKARVRKENGFSSWGYYQDQRHRYLESLLGLITDKRILQLTYLDLQKNMGSSAKAIAFEQPSRQTLVNLEEKKENKTVQYGMVGHWNRLLTTKNLRSFLLRYLETFDYRRLDVKIKTQIREKEDSILEHLSGKMHEQEGTIFARVDLFNEDMKVPEENIRRLRSVARYQKRSSEQFDGIVLEQLESSKIPIERYLNRLTALKGKQILNKYQENLSIHIPYSFIKDYKEASRRKMIRELLDQFQVIILRQNEGGNQALGALMKLIRDESGGATETSIWLEVTNRQVVANIKSLRTPSKYRNTFQSIANSLEFGSQFKGVILDNFHLMRDTVVPD